MKNLGKRLLLCGSLIILSGCVLLKNDNSAEKHEENQQEEVSTLTEKDTVEETADSNPVSSDAEQSDETEIIEPDPNYEYDINLEE